MEHSSLLNKLVDKNLLTIKDEMVCIKPSNQYDFTTYPISEDDCILITFEEYVGLLMRVYMFSEDLTGIVDYVAPEIEEEQEEDEPVEEEPIEEEPAEEEPQEELIEDS